MKPTTEFDEWAKRFEAREYFEYREGLQVKVSEPARCMFAVREGLHKRACLVDAVSRKAGIPVCNKHRGRDVRRSWRGYVEGA